MYFPYLRGKQFELQALLGVPMSVYRNTLPIIEPVKVTGSTYPRSYTELARQGRNIILITNPQAGNLSPAVIQTSLIDGLLSSHPALTLGFLITQHFNIIELDNFLAANPTYSKAIIFRFSPNTTALAAINARLAATPVDYLIFDEHKSHAPVLSAFSWHTNRVIISDGFQRQERNADYPNDSSFYSLFPAWRSLGLVGFGDYLTIGDIYRDGGGSVYVVALHVTVSGSAGLAAYHFQSISNPSVQGIPGPKFLEACQSLVSEPSVAALSSSGLSMYRTWYGNSHFPGLGQAKQASIQHHIELMSALV